MLSKIAPFGAAVVLAFLVVALVRLTDAAETVAYLLTGFAAGVLLLGGILFEFGRKATDDEADVGKYRSPARAGVNRSILLRVFAVFASAGLSLLATPKDSDSSFAART